MYGLGGRGSSELSACRSLLGGAFTVNLMDGFEDDVDDELGRRIVALRERLEAEVLVIRALARVGGMLDGQGWKTYERCEKFSK